MKLKDRIKSAGFWTGLLGALFLILGAFGVEIGDQTASAIINSVCSMLVVFGIVTVPKPTGPETGPDETDKEEDEP